MLSQILEVFEKEYNEKGDDMIIGSYVPADGTYVIMDPQSDGFKELDRFNIKMDKKTREIDTTVSKYMKFVKHADYCSRVTDMNKAILSSSGKVIQGNNYLSFIIKKESLTNGKLTDEIIEKYYSFLENPRLKYNKKRALELYESVEEDIGPVDAERVNKIKGWIKENLFEKFTEVEGKDYLKIFFKYPDEEYKKEGMRYSVPNLYNNNDYNSRIGDMIYGLPNDNMGLNSKKPYLENKTRKSTIPYIVDQNEIMMQKRLFDYLMNNVAAGKANIYIDNEIRSFKNKESIDDKFSGIFLRIKKGKEVEIHDYDIITNFNPKLDKPFEFKNILGSIGDKLNGEYDEFEKLSSLKRIINEVLFSKFLESNYFTDPGDIKINDGILKSNLLMCRTALFNWFYKGRSKNIWMLLNKGSMSLVKGSINNGYMIKATDQFNLRLSMKEYFEGGDCMADIMQGVKSSLRTKISRKDTDFLENDREYCFAVGQLVSFFISRSKGKKKPLALANPFINARRDKVIKDKMRALYKKYNYDIESYNVRFKNLYAMAMSYEIDGRLDEDMIIAGYLHSNLIYEKDSEN